jgi:hypothetical protein
MRALPFRLKLKPTAFPKTKHPFLLFEVLLAIFLVSLCLIPLIRSPIENYRKELNLLKEIEGERWAEWSFSEIKEKFLNNDIPWEKIPTAGTTSSRFHLPPITLELPGLPSKTIERSFILRCTKKSEKQTKNGETYRLLWVDLYFSPKLSQKKIKKKKQDYSFRILVKKTK